MSDEERIENGMKIICSVEELLPGLGIRFFETDEDDLCIRFAVNGADLPMCFNIRVEPSLKLLTIYSPFSFKVREEKAVDVLVALNEVNFSLINGYFYIDTDDNVIMYKMSSCYEDEAITFDLLRYLFTVSLNVVDTYNDRILALNKDFISLDEFLLWQRKQAS